MDEREDLARNLKQLIELDRALGIDFVFKPAATAGLVPAVLDPAVTVKPVPAVKAAVTPAPPPRAPSPEPLSPIADGPDSLEKIAAEIATCRACGLCETRRSTVPGEGNPQPELLFVGEGPGADEDATGRPFVGAAGQLLTKMIIAMGLKREDVYIANIIKCRPPGNRTPEPAEVTACMGYLRRQIALLKPKIICSLGNTPLRALMNDDSLGITRMRGQKLQFAGIIMIPTFHPSYLLRDEEAKKPCWEDLKLVLKELGRELPKRG
ncbi:MAG: uracil-DNA glycosylase [Planctomycetes bacterium]|nr:uracil-DNA glycosylase [Planctomycetota bacterium]